MEDGKVNYYNIYNDDDLFGIGDYLYSDVMYELPFFYNKGNKAIDISIGSHHVLILLDTGEVCTTGINEFGELGLGDTFYRDDFEIIPNLTNVKKVLACNETSLFLLEDGTVYGSGKNNFGVVPTDDIIDIADWFNNEIITTPTQILYTSSYESLPIIKDIFGSTVYYFVDYDNNIYVCGIFENGSYPLYKHNASVMPNFIQLSSELNNTDINLDNFIWDVNQVYLFNEERTKLYVKGLNKYGTLGVGDCLPRQEFTLVDVNWGSPIKKLETFKDEYDLTCACILTLENNDMYFWGYMNALNYNDDHKYNFDEVLGLGDIEPLVTAPIKITMFDEIAPIRNVYGTSFQNHTSYNKPLFLLENNEIYTTGKYPEDIVLLSTDIKNVFVHDMAYHYVLKTDDSLWRESRVDGVFTKILDNVKSFNHYHYDNIATNHRFSNVVVLNTGELYRWDDTFYYYERRGFENRNISFGTPTKIADDVISLIYKRTTIRADYNYFFQTSNYDVYAWGEDNQYGQLGVGVTGTVSTPIKMSATFTSKLIEVIKDNYQSFFIFENGDVYAAGRNTNGELGIGTLLNTSIATRLDLDEINCKDLTIYLGWNTYSVSMNTTDNKTYNWGHELYVYNPLETFTYNIASPMLVIEDEEVLYQDYDLLVTNYAIYKDANKVFETTDTQIERIIPQFSDYIDRDSFLFQTTNGDYYFFGLLGLFEYMHPDYLNIIANTDIWNLWDTPGCIKLDITQIQEPINNILYNIYSYGSEHSVVLYFITDTKIYIQGTVYMGQSNGSDITALDNTDYYNNNIHSCLQPTLIFENSAGFKMVCVLDDEVYIITNTNEMFYRGYPHIRYNGCYESIETEINYYDRIYLNHIYFPTKSPLSDFFNNKSSIQNILHTKTATYYILNSGDIYINGIIYDTIVVPIIEEGPAS